MASSSSSASKSPSPSPSPSAAAADPAGSPPALLPAPPPAPRNPSSRRLPPPCWTHEETLALIDSYRDKWYALRRGNLRAPHWQEVADVVVRRCLRLPAATAKTSVQCRHKIEKLRKRYRSERNRSLSHNNSSWPYFRNMDDMETGASAARSSPSDDDGGGDEVAAADPGGGGATRSLHRLMANGGLRFTVPKAVRSKIVGSRVDDRALVLNPNSSSRFFKGYNTGTSPSAEGMMRQRSEKKRRVEAEGSVGEIVSALRMLGDGFMRMEQMKMDMAREMEKVRMEMELKRTEMVLDSQRRIVDAFIKGSFGSKKRDKTSPDS